MRTARRKNKTKDSNKSLKSTTCDRVLKTALNPRRINRTLYAIRDVNAQFTGKIGPINRQSLCHIDVADKVCC